MNVLVAEDDAVSRKLLETQLVRWGYQVRLVTNGDEALRELEDPDAPLLAILDWMMPGLDGPEICRRVRASERSRQPYLILLTGRESVQDIVSGLSAGADDYVTKPFDAAVLHARVKGGQRILELQTKLASRVRDLEEALAQVKQLQGLLPICCYCKKIRDDNNYWLEVDKYLAEHTDTQLSHGFCPDCYETHIKPQMEELIQKRNRRASENPGK